MIQVQSIRDIAKGSSLWNTYGAIGNGPLLFNYGFCVVDNLEPDGSSNDVWEFWTTTRLTRTSTTLLTTKTTTTISTANSTAATPATMIKIADLQTGPKAYSYCGFIRALDYFYNTLQPKDCDKGSEDPDDTEVSHDDMEAFLNDCDNQQVNSFRDDDNEEAIEEDEVDDDDDEVNKS